MLALSYLRVDEGVLYAANRYLKVGDDQYHLRINGKMLSQYAC